MLKPKGDRVSPRECWGKNVLEGMVSTEALRSGRGWHDWGTERRLLWVTWSEKKGKAQRGLREEAGRDWPWRPGEVFWWVDHIWNARCYSKSLHSILSMIYSFRFCYYSHFREETEAQRGVDWETKNSSTWDEILVCLFQSTGTAQQTTQPPACSSWSWQRSPST